MATSIQLPSLTVAVVGLGYVGLPLALALGRHGPVIGFDIDAGRIAAYREARDPSRELGAESFADTAVEFTSEPARLRAAQIVIIAVPTPLDDTRRPDLSVLIAATELVGAHMRPGSVIVFESTVYPGATEDVCAPALARASGLVSGVDFKLAYSPERINPGDLAHSLESVVKVVAAQDAETLEIVDAMYRKVVAAGTHRAPSIRVAEAAKVLENTQRDLNIALMNELALIFARAGIETHAVIDAAASKWNFADYRPGLVGGHCIGVDPYYLTHMAEKLGYHPDVILAGRRVNDSMGHFIGQITVKQLIAAGKNVAQARVVLLGVTFKPDVSDLRNSRVREVARELADHGVEVILCDPLADPAEVEREYGLGLTPLAQVRNVDGIVATVGHRQHRSLALSGLRELCRANPTLVDVQAIYPRADAEQAGFSYWRL
ncbi:UDP-glucose dehydrogenase [Enhygromyxa salina]|uniref:UDP-glucose dehydrogenase n=1 Tax=Enhygromyxa salina TaxID=215803 RepID=A0A0C2CYA1_9BACT|nr:nucleotide sugar dehydrogenase [Enhygromyxa salina]KIG14625.1 UDP-glucose dehydrogenase [Enhygromyxa salina]